MPATRSRLSREEVSHTMSRFRCLAILSSFLVAACSGPGQNSAAANDSDFWAPFRFSGLEWEVESYSTMEDMSAAADAVVSARIVGVGPGRIFQGDVAADRVYYASLTLEVDSVLHGTVGEPTLNLELLLPRIFDDAGFETAIKELASVARRDQILVFLRAKRDPDPDIYRPVNSVGLFAETSRADVDTPLSAESPSAAAVYGPALDAVQDIDELIARVAATN